MSDYQKLILDRVKDQINVWLETLKQKQPELLLTRQWRIVWLKGFTQGQNVMPVITSCKNGEYLIGEIQMVLSPSLDLDLEAVELALKEEPYEVPAEVFAVPSVDGPLDLLNDLVVEINGYLSGMPLQGIDVAKASDSRSLFAPLKVHSGGPDTMAITGIDRKVQDDLLKSAHLPEWFKTIESREVKQGVLNRLIEAYAQYSRSKGYSVPLKEFFEDFTDRLLRQNKVHYHCPYKGKGVEMDFQGHCTEAFCSKKPHNAVCPVPNLRFGALES